MYPLISEYVEAIKSAEDNFNELGYLRPVLGDDGLPMMTSGNFAVVFKMKDEQRGRLYALKCFTKEQEGREEAYREIAKELKEVSSPYLVPIRYLEKELFVDSKQTDDTEFPVLLMDWVEGMTLDKYLRDNLENKYELEMLAYRFSQLAQWLIPQSFAHGDLKPDNILVREDGTLVLVDYDGMYVPAMKGQKARELGSPDFRHPSRTEDDYDEHIDDFSLLVLTLSILVVCESPSSFSIPIFTENDFHNPKSSQTFKHIYPSNNSSINKTVSALVNCIIDNEMILPISIYNTISKHIRWEYYTYAQNYYDRLKELGVNPHRFHRKGGFNEDGKLYPVELFNLPASIRGFNIYHEYGYGHYFYKGCLLRAWDYETDSYLGDIYDEVWQEIALPSDTIVIGKEALSNSTLVELIIVPNSVKYIGDKAFYNCESLRYIVLPDSIEGFGTEILKIKESYVNIKTGDTDTQHYGKGTHSLMNIIVPDGRKEYYAKLLPDYRHLLVDFSGLVNSKDTSINSLSVNIAKKKKAEDRQLSTIVTDEDLANAWTDEYGVKYSADKIRLLKAPTGIKVYSIQVGTMVICDYAFSFCQLKSISIPSSITSIGIHAFSSSYLTSIIIPNSVRFIYRFAFHNCSGLTSILIPNSVRFLGRGVFASCSSLLFISLPFTVIAIEECILAGCENLHYIQIPLGTKNYFDKLLPEYKSKFVEI